MFNNKISILNLVLINFLIFYISILFAVIPITLAKLVGDVCIFKHFKDIFYHIFFLTISDLGVKNLFIFWFKNLFIIFLLIFCSLLGSSLQYVFIKNEYNSSTNVCSQFCGFFDLYFKYLTICSIILFLFLIIIKF